MTAIGPVLRLADRSARNVREIRNLHQGVREDGRRTRAGPDMRKARHPGKGVTGLERASQGSDGAITEEASRPGRSLQNRSKGRDASSTRAGDPRRYQRAGRRYHRCRLSTTPAVRDEHHYLIVTAPQSVCRPRHHEATVHGGPRHPQHAGDRSHMMLARGVHRAGRRELLLRPYRRPATLPTPRPRGRQTGHRPLPDQVPLKLRQRGEPWKTSRPPGVAVSMDSVRDRNATPRPSKSATTSSRCRSDRPSRSSRHTTVRLETGGRSDSGKHSRVRQLVACRQRVEAVEFFA